MTSNPNPVRHPLVPTMGGHPRCESRLELVADSEFLTVCRRDFAKASAHYRYRRAGALGRRTVSTSSAIKQHASLARMWAGLRDDQIAFGSISALRATVSTVRQRLFSTCFARASSISQAVNPESGANTVECAQGVFTLNIFWRY